MLPVAEIIRTMRREKNVTQDELAQALGVTFQSVSRWENGIAYPDIELLPKIAAFFDITTDRLLGADKENRMRKRIATLQAYNDAYARTDDPCARFTIMKKAYEEFPESEYFASRALTELVYNDAVPREEGLPFARECCRKILENTKNDQTRLATIHKIFIYEDEDRLDEWKKYVSVSATVPQLLSNRYYHRGEAEKYNRQTQTNIFLQLADLFAARFWQLTDGNDPKEMDPVKTAEGQKIVLRMLDALTETPSEIDGWSGHRMNACVLLAAARFRLGEKEEAYASLETAVDLTDRLAGLPEDAEIGFCHPFFDLITVPVDYAGYRIPYLRATVSNLFFLLSRSEGISKWFDPYREEERFQCCIKRIRVHLPEE